MIGASVDADAALTLCDNEGYPAARGQDDCDHAEERVSFRVEETQRGPQARDVEPA